MPESKDVSKAVTVGYYCEKEGGKDTKELVLME